MARTREPAVVLSDSAKKEMIRRAYKTVVCVSMNNWCAASSRNVRVFTWHIRWTRNAGESGYSTSVKRCLVESLLPFLTLSETLNHLPHTPPTDQEENVASSNMHILEKNFIANESVNSGKRVGHLDPINNHQMDALICQFCAGSSGTSSMVGEKMSYIVVASFIGAASAYFGWSGSNDYNFLDERTATPVPSPSNLACFFCSQLLSVTKHRVGLSQNQLRAVLHDKCRVLPIVLKEQCFAFVETSLPEIYFSLNYDFSTKDICVRLSLCEEDNPFAVAGTPPEDPSTISTASPRVGGDEHSAETTTSGIHRKKARQDRADRKNTDQNSKNEEKRITCAFCERMLENAKNYAVTAKTDINSFASTACSKLPKGRYSDHCHQLADKKIAELAKFVDQQVIEALWCAELNQC
ncbi:hypothetical protein RB195_002258 [Necator americanus]|uniref:Saposin B-type domain-containing protein n=1 Tax=Necator americanus TaxID=51031 RepID=A0ABR1DI50_NECAM